MNRAILNLFKPFILPLIIVACVVFVAVNWPNVSDLSEDRMLLHSLLVLLPYLPYLFFALGILFGFRSHNTGLIINSIILICSYYGLLQYSPNLPSLPLFIAFLLPINFLIWCRVQNKYLFGKAGIIYLIILFLEMSLVMFSSNFIDNRNSAFWQEFHLEFPAVAAHLQTSLSYFFDFLTFHLIVNSLMIYLTLFIVLVIFVFEYFKKNNVVNAYYFILLLAIFPGIMGYRNQVIIQLFFTAAGLILILSSIESSFYMAYVDELTALPGRRRLNESLLNLGKKYCIAMIDVDHFKKFNDTYGHESGDQALKMIASKLNSKQECGRTFRYGGEEFTTIFPGKSLEEAVPILEECRKAIEKTLFIIRDKDRKFQSVEQRGKKRVPRSQQVRITVSIGAAQADKTLNKPEKVLKAADKILYKAKHQGRNRIQIFNK